MKDPNAVIVKQITYEECLNKDRIVLIKYIVARIADLNPFPTNCSLEMKYEIFDRIEEKLSKSYKYELIDILGSKNELKMICSDMKNSMLKEVVNSFNDGEVDESDSDITDVSSEDESGVVDLIRGVTRGRKSRVKIKFN